MRNTWAAYLVDTNTGNIEWTLGGKHSSFKFASGASFQWQHDVQLHKGNMVSVFDDACCAIGASDRRRRAVRPAGWCCRLDTSAKTVTQAAQYTRGKKFNAAFLGNTDLLPNGNVAIGWGSQPFFSELSKTGKVLLDVAFPNPDVNYRTYVQRWTATPSRGAQRGRAQGQTRRAGVRELERRHPAGRVARDGRQRCKASCSGRLPSGQDRIRDPDQAGLDYKAYKVQALDSKGHVLRTSGLFPTAKPPSTLPPGY